MVKKPRNISSRFRLVVLDVMMPKLDGYGVCQELQRSVPIIMLTALGDVAENRWTGAGADDYVVKPFSPRAGSPIRLAPARRQKKCFWHPQNWGNPSRKSENRYEQAASLQRR